MKCYSIFFHAEVKILGKTTYYLCPCYRYIWQSALFSQNISEKKNMFFLFYLNFKVLEDVFTECYRFREVHDVASIFTHVCEPKPTL